MGWKLITSNRNPLLIYELKMAGFRLGFKRFFGYDYLNFKWDRGSIYADEETMAKFVEFLVCAYSKDLSFFDKIFAEERKVISRFVSNCHHLRETRQSSGKKMWLLIQQYFELYMDITKFLLVNVACGNILENRLKEIVKSRHEFREDEERNRNCVLALTCPQKETGTSRSTTLLLKAAQARDMKQREQIISRFLKLYAWTNLEDGFGMPFDRGEIARRVCDLKEVYTKEKMTLLNQEKKALKKRIEEYVHTLRLNRNEMGIYNHAQEIIFLRVYLNDSINRGGYIARPFFQRLAEKLGVTYELLFFARADEIGMTLLHRSHLSVRMLQEREKGYAIIMESGKLRMLWGEALAELDEKYTERAKKGTTLTGEVACKGKVKGIVRVILKATQVTSLQKGNVLIAGSLTPEYTRGIQKASGIAADVGGMNSHAAIISREFGIPCVMGLEHASTLFRDGDIVELDANKGKITRIG